MVFIIGNSRLELKDSFNPNFEKTLTVSKISITGEFGPSVTVFLGLEDMAELGAYLTETSKKLPSSK